MANSVILVTWINMEHPEGISRQLPIPPDIDPRSLSDEDIWDRCSDSGFYAYGAMTWEILINNSATCHQTVAQIRASRLYEKLADLLIADREAMGALHELYEIAHDSGDR